MGGSLEGTPIKRSVTLAGASREDCTLHSAMRAHSEGWGNGRRCLGLGRESTLFIAMV
jgi:hypothetical protein